MYLFHYAPKLQINYEKEGTGPVTLIFLHGFAASLRSWDDIRGLFPLDQFTMYFVDLKGFGESTKPRDGKYSLTEQAEIISAFVKNTKSREVILIGHSFGGAVALAVYLLNLREKTNKIFSRIVLIDCAAYPNDLKSFLKFSRLPFITESVYIMPRSLASRGALSFLFYDRKKVTNKVVQRYAPFLKLENAKYSLIKTGRLVTSENFNTYILQYSRIKIPALILWGRNDPIIPIGSGTKLHRELVNSEMKAIDKCGHIPHEEQPLETFTRIIDFIS